jgi:hypothetical protein
MKVIMESWRKFVNEAKISNSVANDLKQVTTALQYIDSAGSDGARDKELVDISGMGSNELGDPYDEDSLAYKIRNNIINHCTSSSDCADKAGGMGALAATNDIVDKSFASIESLSPSKQRSIDEKEDLLNKFKKYDQSSEGASRQLLQSAGLNVLVDILDQDYPDISDDLRIDALSSVFYTAVMYVKGVTATDQELERQAAIPGYTPPPSYEELISDVRYTIEKYSD